MEQEENNINVEIESKDVVKSTKEGRLYIPTKDFFKQKKVKVLIDKLLNSSLIEEIEENKKDLETA